MWNIEVEKDLILLHKDYFSHQGLNYEILFIDYNNANNENQSLPEIRNFLYSSLKEYFNKDFLHLIRIPNSITFFCFPAPEDIDKWEPYNTDFTDKIAQIEESLR